MSQFLPLVVPELPKFFLLFGDITPNFAPKLEARSKSPRPPDMEVPPPPWGVDIREDVKSYQETLSYASSKVDYSVGEHLYMLPSDMELRIRSTTVGYNNKILVSNKNINLGKNDEVNSLKTPAIETNSLETPAIESHSYTAQGLTHAPAISNHEDE